MGPEPVWCSRPHCMLVVCGPMPVPSRGAWSRRSIEVATPTESHGQEPERLQDNAHQLAGWYAAPESTVRRVHCSMRLTRLMLRYSEAISAVGHAQQHHQLRQVLVANVGH